MDELIYLWLQGTVRTMTDTLAREKFSRENSNLKRHPHLKVQSRIIY